MNTLLDLLRVDPWPWYVVGPLIGLLVPLLLLVGSHLFGVSSSLRHLCAAIVPGRAAYFHYDWRKESWNLWFVAGIVLGGFIAAQWLGGGGPEALDPEMVARLKSWGLSADGQLIPPEFLEFAGPLGGIGLVLLIPGGFLVGFGARYAGGCTSGHTIAGLASLQRASLVATLAFMAGGLLTARVIVPWLFEVLR